MKGYLPNSQTSFRNYTESNNQIPSMDRYTPYYNPQDKLLSPLSPSTQTNYNSQKQLYRISSTSNFSEYQQPLQPPCQCGMATQATRLRIQNSQLKQQISNLKQTGTMPNNDNSYRAKFQIYQQYLSNSQINNDTLRKENNQLRKQTEMIESLKRRVELLEEEKQLMEENLRQQMEENINIQQQYQKDFYNSPTGVYVEELERNNRHLIGENKRLTGIITQRIKNTFV